MKKYQSPYEAYPFLSEEPDDLRCDFELLTDEIASQIGLLRSKVEEKKLKEDLLWIDELIYHLNPTLRTKLSVTEEEKDHLINLHDNLKDEYKFNDFNFVLPQGSESASLAHILRVQTKKLVRLIYRYCYQGNEVDPLLIDIVNILSGYFFYLALKLNKEDNVKEIEFISRNYK